MRILTVRKVALKSPYDHLELHNICFPEFEDKGFYRTMISYSAFFESLKRRNWTESCVYYLDDESPIRKTPWEQNRDKKLPVFQHDSLYDFFEHIGYDRKRKKII